MTARQTFWISLSTLAGGVAVLLFTTETALGATLVTAGAGGGAAAHVRGKRKG